MLSLVELERVAEVISGCLLRVRSLPPSLLPRLHLLEELDIEGNRLTVVPDNLDKLTMLTKLYLSRNALADIPLEVRSGRRSRRAPASRRYLPALLLTFSRRGGRRWAT